MRSWGITITTMSRWRSLRRSLHTAAICPACAWTMPAKWYAFDFPKENPLVNFIALDSNYHNRVGSLTETERACAERVVQSRDRQAADAPYLIVMAHHPIYSNGVHGDTIALIEEWSPLLEEDNAHFYFCGHDHDMQHMEFDDHPTSFILSAAVAPHPPD